MISTVSIFISCSSWFENVSTKYVHHFPTIKLFCLLLIEKAVLVFVQHFLKPNCTGLPSYTAISFLLISLSAGQIELPLRSGARTAPAVVFGETGKAKENALRSEQTTWRQLLPGHPLQPQTLATWRLMHHDRHFFYRGKDSRCLASWRNKSTESTEHGEHVG